MTGAEIQTRRQSYCRRPFRFVSRFISTQCFLVSRAGKKCYSACLPLCFRSRHCQCDREPLARQASADRSDDAAMASGLHEADEGLVASLPPQFSFEQVLPRSFRLSSSFPHNRTDYAPRSASPRPTNASIRTRNSPCACARANERASVRARVHTRLSIARACVRLRAHLRRVRCCHPSLSGCCR
jgi:hypothetical protein